MAVTVAKVTHDSPAEHLGIKAGDRILSVNGFAVADELDFQFHLLGGAPEPLLALETSKGKRRRLQVHPEEGTDFGLQFEDFAVRTCRNKCLFCFVRQLPKGVRPSLRIRDDDFRLSFLHGNYLSLTNLREADIRRIIKQKFSPLYVSVHSTNPDVRSRLLGCAPMDCGLETLWRLVRSGIEIHAQIVLCPGINDQIHLQKTLLRLFRSHPRIASVAIVPVGLTRHRSHLPALRPVTAQTAHDVLALIHNLQDYFCQKSGTRFAFPADEFYLLADQPIPSGERYEGFLQLEDGIGMLASFRQDFNRIMRRHRTLPTGSLDGTLVTGSLFAPFLEEYARRLQRRYGGCLRTVKVENRFLGPGVTVAGLLSGRDILHALQGRDLGRWVMVPGESLSQDQHLFLDGLTLQDLKQELGLPVGEAERSAEGFFGTLHTLNSLPVGTRPVHFR